LSIPAFYQLQCVKHMPLSQETVGMPLQVLPSSSMGSAAGQAQPGQVACQAASAVAKALVWEWLKPIACCEPQQLSWCKPKEQLSLLVQPRSKVMNGMPLPQPLPVGGGQVPLEHALPEPQVAPLATHTSRWAVLSQQPDPHTPPVQQASPGAPHWTHTPSPQTRPEAAHSPAQQGWPAPPHWAHTLLAQL
jgi:hypothetical protein